VKRRCRLTLWLYRVSKNRIFLFYVEVDINHKFWTRSTRRMNVATESMESDKYRRVAASRRPIAPFFPMLESNSRNILASGEPKSENLSRNLHVTWLFHGHDEIVRETRNDEGRIVKKSVCYRSYRQITLHPSRRRYVDIPRVRTVVDAGSE